MNMKREYLEYVNGEYTEVRNFLKEKDGVVDLDKQKMFLDKLTVPYESWIETRKGTGSTGTETGGKQVTAENGIVEIMTKWDLVDDNGKLKPRKFLKEGFAELAKELEQHGYRYNKNAGGFLPAWKGVKR
ncbi:MAG: hypothetical protein ACYCT2_03210 [Thermoplasmataceae archaeon]